MSVRDETTNREVNVVTDINGAFAIASLKDGTYRVEVLLPGLQPLVKEHLALKQNEIAHAQVTLRFDMDTTITVGALAVDPLMENHGMTTTLTKDVLDKLPIGN